MALRGHLKMLILTELQDEPRSGYGLMNEIQKKTGNRPSAGSMYPLLEHLATEGLIVCKKRGNKKIYSLNAQEANIDKARQTQKILQDLRQNVRMLSAVLGQDVSSCMQTIESHISEYVSPSLVRPVTD